MDQAGLPVYHQVRLDRDYLAGKALDLFGKKHPGIWRTASAARKARVLEEFRDLISSLEESLAIDNPAVFIDHACWARVYLTSLHFPRNYVPFLLDTLGEVLQKELPLDFRKEAGGFVTESLVVLKTASPEIPSYITADNPLADVARSFLAAVIAADRKRAEGIMDDTLRSGTPLKDIYLNIFQPVLQETGRLWQMQKIGIAQEHFVTAYVEIHMARLHERFLSPDWGGKVRRQKTVVACGVGPELHDVGIHMVADFFEMDGWDTYYVGANTPIQSILEAVRDRKADIIALSTTMPRHLPDVQYLIRSLRADGDTMGVKIIVGGYPFRIVPDLWKQIGADAYAGTADEAVAVANRLVPRHR
ncbi:MAG: cobalamin-dependent protein [Methanoregula sp.]|jgi:methanogenic corrinoid protein MtbC1|uniref:cobalamin B12-binding domain-containing protein n=1 Tax=Methanoregula sp. TaxID=2052170 RepID=UPI003C76FB5F